MSLIKKILKAWLYVQGNYWLLYLKYLDYFILWLLLLIIIFNSSVKRFCTYQLQTASFQVFQGWLCTVCRWKRREMDMTVTFLQGYICYHKIRKSLWASNYLTWRSHELPIGCAQTKWRAEFHGHWILYFLGNAYSYKNLFSCIFLHLIFQDSFHIF